MKRRQKVATIIILSVLILAYLSTFDNAIPRENKTINNTSENALLAADGDISGESITSFSETIGDDILFYPDAILNDSVLNSDSGSTDASTPTGSHTDTHSLNDVFYGGTDSGAMSVTLWITVSADIEGFTYAAYWNGSGPSSTEILASLTPTISGGVDSMILRIIVFAIVALVVILLALYRRRDIDE